MKAGDGEGVVKVELFGPFRAYGSSREVMIEGPVSFEELVGALEGELGSGFSERAHKKNTTFIINNKIISSRELEEVRIAPGDRVAFALLMGGG